MTARRRSRPAAAPTTAAALAHPVRAAAPAAPAGPRTRLAGIDMLRGLAIVAMIAYHFCYDLVLFRWAHWRMLEEPAWIAARSAILSGFLLLAGVSLVLRARFKPAWRDFWQRWIEIAGAALLVTLGSALMFPRSFIYFGVLHHIALMLIAARLMLPLGRWNALIGVAIVLAGNTLGFDTMNPKWLNWIGFITQKPYTEDYVPVFPWFGVMLIGVALATAWGQRGLAPWAPLAALGGALPRMFTCALAWLGRWSLAAYLVHQPILIGALWLLRAVSR